MNFKDNEINLVKQMLEDKIHTHRKVYKQVKLNIPNFGPLCTGFSVAARLVVELATLGEWSPLRTKISKYMCYMQ